MYYLVLRKFSYLIYRLKFRNNQNFKNSLKPLFKDLNFLDFGAYKYDWYDKSYAKYIAFEPNKNFNPPAEISNDITLIRDIISEEISVVRFYDEGLTSGTSLSILTKADYSSSFDVKCRPLKPGEHQLFENSVLKINIEGEEYALLEYLYSLDLISKCKFVLLQTHPVGSHSKTFKALKRKHNIMKESGFTLEYKYPLIWELWRR